MPQYLGSTTALNSGQTYTSQWVNSDYWSKITGTAFADQAGTVFVEQSGNGVNVDLINSTAVVASTGAGFSQDLYLPYVRVRYLNGGTNQGLMRLTVRFVPGEAP